MADSKVLSHFGRSHSWAWAWLLALIASLIALSLTLACRCRALQGQQPSTAATRLARDRQLLEGVDRLKLSTSQLGRLWAEIASDEEDLGHFTQAEEAYHQALLQLGSDPALREDYAVVLNNLGALYSIRGNPEASLDCRRRALAILEKFGNPLAVARAQGYLADAYLRLGKNKEAREHAGIAYRALETLPNAKPQDKASVLVGYSYACCLTRHCPEGLEAIRRAYTLAKEVYPAEAFPIGQILTAKGFAEWRTGDRAAAETDLREAIRVLQINLPAGHPFVVQALEFYQGFLSDGPHDVGPRQITEETRRFTQQVRGCAGCTVSVNSLRGR